MLFASFGKTFSLLIRQPRYLDAREQLDSINRPMRILNMHLADLEGLHSPSTSTLFTDLPILYALSDLQPSIPVGSGQFRSSLQLDQSALLPILNPTTKFAQQVGLVVPTCVGREIDDTNAPAGGHTLTRPEVTRV